MSSNKQKVAFNSVLAAVGLTAAKIAVGVLTGSLGVLSEALHSVLDLVAAVVTLFAVRFSDKPADAEHQYGHGKIENLSALIETALLLVTCVWIAYEAVEKIITHNKLEIPGVIWGLLVVLASVAVNIWRARILLKASEEHNSQALKADALHFKTDVWSSAVVAVGLVCVWAGGVFNLPFLKYADPVAALGVAAIVARVSLRLGRETIDSLLDAAPKGMREKIKKEVSAVPGVLQVADIRIRPSGAFYYVEVSVGIDPDLSQKTAQRIVLGIKERIATVAERCDVIVGTFPASLGGTADTGVTAALESIVESMPNCENVHNVHVYELGGKKRITAHVELTENLTLRESHELSHKISDKVQQAVPSVDYVNLYFQRAQQGVQTEEITSERKDLAENIQKTVERLANGVDCHEIRLFKSGKQGVTAFLHCGVPEDFRMDKIESLSGAVKSELRSRLPELDHVHIHFEPADEE